MPATVSPQPPTPARAAGFRRRVQPGSACGPQAPDVTALVARRSGAAVSGAVPQADRVHFDLKHFQMVCN